MSKVKLEELSAGDVVIADGGFPCMAAGDKPVLEDEHGLYVICKGAEDDPDDECHHHYLDGQVGDDGFLVGITRRARS